MEKFEVVIIGAGPAGLSAAKVLVEGGKKVLLLEKNQKIGKKICAGGLTLKDLELGIPISLAERIFYSIKINYLDKTFEVKRDKPFVVTIDREKLGQWQLQQIKKNIEIRTNSEVVDIKNNSVLLKDGQEIGFDYLIGADGSLSLVRQHLGLSAKKIGLSMQYIVPEAFNNLEVFFNQDLFGTGYVWIFPHGDYTSIGCGQELEFQNTSKLSKNFHQWLKEKKIDFSQNKFESAPINFDYRGFNFGNKFLIGDAAGFASGLTGEGIYFAIVSGQEVAQRILNPNYSLPKLKKILKIKKYQETFGKFLLFKILRVKPLARFLFRKYI